MKILLTIVMTLALTGTAGAGIVDAWDSMVAANADERTWGFYPAWKFLNYDSKDGETIIVQRHASLLLTLECGQLDLQLDAMRNFSFFVDFVVATGSISEKGNIWYVDNYPEFMRQTRRIMKPTVTSEVCKWNERVVSELTKERMSIKDPFGR